MRVLQLLDGIGPGKARQAVHHLQQQGEGVRGLLTWKAPAAAREAVEGLAGLLTRLTDEVGLPVAAQIGRVRRFFEAAFERLRQDFKDTASRFLRVNQALAQRFGFRSPDEALGRTDFELFTEEHARQAYEDEQQILRTGQPLIGKEEKETWPDGHITWVSTTKMPLRDRQGQIIGTFGISRDITKRRQAEEALRDSEERFRATFEQAAVGIAHVGTDGRWLRVNQKLCDIVGYSRDVHALFTALPLREEVVAALRKDSTLNDADREFALQVAQTYSEDAPAVSLTTGWATMPRRWRRCSSPKNST
jgi:PAS domain S-box-containing protein